MGVEGVEGVKRTLVYKHDVVYIGCMLSGMVKWYVKQYGIH